MKQGKHTRRGNKMETIYNVKTGTAFENQTIRVFATWKEANDFTNSYFAETGEQSWVSREESAAAPAKAYTTPATH